MNVFEYLIHFGCVGNKLLATFLLRLATLDKDVGYTVPPDVKELITFNLLDGIVSEKSFALYSQFIDV